MLSFRRVCVASSIQDLDDATYLTTARSFSLLRPRRCDRLPRARSRERVESGDLEGRAQLERGDSPSLAPLPRGGRRCIGVSSSESRAASEDGVCKRAATRGHGRLLAAERRAASSPEGAEGVRVFDALVKAARVSRDRRDGAAGRCAGAPQRDLQTQVVGVGLRPVAAPSATSLRACRPSTTATPSASSRLARVARSLGLARE